MEEKKTIKISLSTLFLILELIVIIGMAYYIYVEKTNTNDEIDMLEANIIDIENTIDGLQQKNENVSNIINNDSSIKISKNEKTELKLGTYQITEHIETDGPGFDDVGVTIADNNLCSVYEGYGSSRLGTYYIENNKMICNTLIYRGEEGGILYIEGNIIFEFEIIGEDELKLINITNNTDHTFANEALEVGRTYKLSNANIKVLIDND